MFAVGFCRVGEGPYFTFTSVLAHGYFLEKLHKLLMTLIILLQLAVRHTVFDFLIFTGTTGRCEKYLLCKNISYFAEK